MPTTRRYLRIRAALVPGFVAVKSEVTRPAMVIFRACDTMIGRRAQLINANRGHLAASCRIAARGSLSVAPAFAQIGDLASHIPPIA